MKDKKYDSELKYAQWNPFYISLQKDIDQIKYVNKVIRKETDMIDEFFSLINSLFNSTCFALVGETEILKKLNDLENKIYDPTYLRDIHNNSKQKVNIILYQHKIIKDLENIFKIIIKNLSEEGLIPKIDKIEKKDKGKALYS